MKRIIKLMSLFTLAIIMTVSSFIIVTAEEVNPPENESVTITECDDDNPARAYELVWRYKAEYGHMYKRRWNMTLGCWYDPEWILVY